MPEIRMSCICGAAGRHPSQMPWPPISNRWAQAAATTGIQMMCRMLRFSRTGTAQVLQPHAPWLPCIGSRVLIAHAAHCNCHINLPKCPEMHEMHACHGHSVQTNKQWTLHIELLCISPLIGKLAASSSAVSVQQQWHCRCLAVLSTLVPVDTPPEMSWICIAMPEQYTDFMLELPSAKATHHPDNGAGPPPKQLNKGVSYGDSPVLGLCLYGVSSIFLSTMLTCAKLLGMSAPPPPPPPSSAILHMTQ